MEATLCPFYANSFLFELCRGLDFGTGEVLPEHSPPMPCCKLYMLILNAMNLQPDLCFLGGLVVMCWKRNLWLWGAARSFRNSPAAPMALYE